MSGGNGDVLVKHQTAGGGLESSPHLAPSVSPPVSGSLAEGLGLISMKIKSLPISITRNMLET